MSVDLGVDGDVEVSVAVLKYTFFACEGLYPTNISSQIRRGSNRGCFIAFP